MPKKVCVIGLGFIGLPTACLMAEGGFEVAAVDRDSERIANLKAGRLPFAELGLDDLFAKVQNRMIFDTKATPADIFVICVPTPLTAGDVADLSYVRDAIDQIKPLVKAGDLVITESTIPPLCHKDLIQPQLAELNLHFAYVPERALVGNTLYEMRHNARVIGVSDEIAAKEAYALYSSFVRGEIHISEILSAEMTKLIENAYRDTNIAFANELSKICDHMGANVWEVIRLANLHPRVNVMQPGPGVGGHCLPIDPWFLIENKPAGHQMVAVTRQINDSMPLYVADQVMEMVAHIANPKVVVLGVAYKADVDDARETPALAVGKRLTDYGCEVVFHDPLVTKFAHPVSDGLAALTAEADCLVLITNHTVYGEIDPTTITNMRHKLVFDSRNQLAHEAWSRAGFEIKTLGLHLPIVQATHEKSDISN